jgi:hypothetical protein
MFDGAPDWALAKSPEPRRSKGSASSSLFDHYYMKDSEDAFAKALNHLMRQRSATLVDQAPGEIEIRKRSQYIAPIGDMSPYPLNVATGASALHPAFRQAKKSYFCNVNGLPNCRLVVTNRGRPIAKHPAVYSPIPGEIQHFPTVRRVLC